MNTSTDVQFTATEQELRQIQRIVRRAMKGGISGNDSLSLSMDIEATHSNGIPLDFHKLLTSPAFDFSHDICGIQEHLNRETGQLEHCFLPRCARPSRRTAR